MDGTDWRGYLSHFHAAHPGITEGVVAHAVDASGATPYDWLAEAVPAGREVLDLACGNGPLATRLRPGRWLGLDASGAELAVAARRGLTRLARADASRLPLPDASVDVVACSMALMLVPLGPALAEVRRVLRPGGLLVATVPSDRPLSAGDWLHYARLCLTLRHTRLRYPNDGALAHAGSVLGCHGLELTGDERRRFVCQIEHPAIAVMLVDSLYLPDTPPERLDAARRVAAGWAGVRLGLPVRRLVARARLGPLTTLHRHRGAYGGSDLTLSPTDRLSTGPGAAAPTDALLRRPWSYRPRGPTPRSTGGGA